MLCKLDHCCWTNAPLLVNILIFYFVIHADAIGENLTRRRSSPTHHHPVCASFEASGAMLGLNELATPNFPRIYPPCVDCVRVLHAPDGYDILVHFRGVFEIESSYEASLENPFSVSTNCPNDYLEIHDGRHSFSPMLARLCGMSAPTAPIRAASGFAWLHFHSDALLEYRGALAAYEFVRAQDEAHLNSVYTKKRSQCYQLYNGNFDGRINSSFVREFYSLFMTEQQQINSIECVWEIRVPHWLSVAVFVEELRLSSSSQCADNALEIFAGRISPTPIRQYCSGAQTHVYTAHSIVLLRFFAKSIAQLNSFEAKILFSTYILRKNCTIEKASLFACGDDICIPEQLRCNGNDNCLYHMDEINCDRGQGLLLQLLWSSYGVLLVVLAGTLFGVMGLCIWYWPCDSNMDVDPLLDSYFRQISSLPSEIPTKSSRKISRQNCCGNTMDYRYSHKLSDNSSKHRNQDTKCVNGKLTRNEKTSLTNGSLARPFAHDAAEILVRVLPAKVERARGDVSLDATRRRVTFERL